ncbi:MAG: S8 family serine peptidase [Opitutales bacterium]
MTPSPIAGSPNPSTAAKTNSQKTNVSSSPQAAQSPLPTYTRALDDDQIKLYRSVWEQYDQPEITVKETFSAIIVEERNQFPSPLHGDDRARFTARLIELEQLQEAAVIARISELGLKRNGTDSSGRHYTIIGFHEDGSPYYSMPENDKAAISTAASYVREQASFDSVFGPDINGSGFQVNVNDSGTIYMHAEFEDRVTIMRTNDFGDRNHMTHVAGTIGAAGIDPRAQGMAPKVDILSFIGQSTSDIYGYGMSYPGEDGKSIIGNTSLGGAVSKGGGGAYSASDASMDTALFDTPYYLHFFSAGNSGNNWDTITTSQKEAKNLMAVANAKNAQRASDGTFTSGAGLVGSSSRGPIDDGRIKPDITANGDNVYSTVGTSGYRSLTGTSMASPNAAGSAVLLQDYFNKRFPRHYMRAATLKGLIIHGADDRGKTGPDYKFGWGLMNTLASAKVIKGYADNPASRRMVEAELGQGEVHDYTFTYSGTAPIRATLTWWDPAGPTGTSSGSANDRTPDITNDLNVRILSPSAVQHLPYVMKFVTSGFNNKKIDTNAARGINTTDTVEMVLVENPSEMGVYTVEVSHAGSLQNGSQKYSLILSGPDGSDPEQAITVSSISPSATSLEKTTLEVEGSGFLLGANLALRRPGQSDIALSNIVVEPHKISGSVDLSSVTSGYWDLVITNPSGSEYISEDAFLFQYNALVEEIRQPNLAIPDNVSAGVTDTLLVTSNQTIEDLDLYLDIEHTYVGDLIVTLRHVDSGASSTVISRPSSGTADDIKIILDDEALNDVGNGAPYTLWERYIPENPLSVFDGINMAGTWEITVADRATADTGILLEWRLQSRTGIEAFEYSKLRIDDISVDEDAGNATLTATLDLPNISTVSFDYTTQDNTASASSDYTAQSGTAHIAAGETSAQINIPILMDQVVDPDEAFYVTLSDPSNNMGIRDNLGIASIQDVSTPFMLWLDNYALTLAEAYLDEDRDGIPNIAEYAFNLDPTEHLRPIYDPNLPVPAEGPFGLPRIELIDDSGDQRLQIIYPRRISRAASGIDYTAFFSDELSTWIEHAPSSVDPLSSDWERITVLDTYTTETAPNGMRFGRVEVSTE